MINSSSKFRGTVSLFLIASLGAWSLVAGCSDGGGSGGPAGSGGEGNISVKLGSKTLTTSARLAAPQLASTNGNTSGTIISTSSTDCVTYTSSVYCQCQITNNASASASINKEGYCSTPLSVKGGISAVALFEAGRIPARILGGGMQLSTKQGGALDVKDFDLKNVSTLQGTDNIEDSGNASSLGKAQWSGVQAYFSHVDVRMPPLQYTDPTSLTTLTQYNTLRYVGYAQPVLSETTISNCGIDSAGMASISANSNYLSSLSFKRNDVMICSRTDATECANSEYQFLDTSSSTLTQTRPSTLTSAYQLSMTQDSDLSCSVDSSGIPNMNMGGIWVLATIASPFNLTGAISGGVKTYTLTPTTGSTTTGTMATVHVDFDLTNQVFVETGGALSPSAFAVWLDTYGPPKKMIQKMNFTPLYVRSLLKSLYSGSSYTTQDSGLNATVSVTLQ
jgi:hypothetical protein